MTSDKLISITRDEYKAVMRSLRKGDIYQYKADNQKALDVYAETLEMVCSRKPLAGIHP